MANIYLSHDNQVDGPFTDQQIEEMKANGTIHKYSWYWDGTSPDWVPISPPPPKPPLPSVPPQNVFKKITVTAPAAAAPIPAAAAAQAPTPAPTAPVVTREEISVSPSMAALPFRVICHDFHHLISGTFVEIADRGCTILIPPPKGGLPELHIGQRIWLSVLNEKSGEAENTQGKVEKTRRITNGEWVYEVTWQKVPQLLLSSRTTN